MNKLTAQIQTTARGSAYAAWARAVKPRAIKLLQGGIDNDLLAFLADHGLELVVLRETHNENGVLSEARERVTSLLRLAERLRWLQTRGVRVALEFPYNEEAQTSPSLIAGLADATIVEGQRVLDAGWDLVIGIFSEGNPSDLAWWQQFHPALRWARQQWQHGRRVFLGLHEYSAPGPPVNGPFDGWHEGRYRRVWATLPDDCKVPIMVVEGGVDGGVVGRRATGWRSFYPSPAAYLPAMRRRRAEYARDAYVWWVFDFLIGSEDEWRDFDLGDEVDLRPAWTEDEPGPARWVPEPVEVAPVSDRKLTIGIFRTATGDVPPSRRPQVAYKAALRRAGAAYDCAKFAEADTWAGLYDPTGMTPRNGDEAAAQVAYLASDDDGPAVGSIPWGVPRGFDVLAEARFLGRICDEHSTGQQIIIDFEWLYAGFWGCALNGAALPLPRRIAFGPQGPTYGDGTYSSWDEAARDFFRALRYCCGAAATIILNPDPRQIRDGAYDLAALLDAGAITAVMPQTYWTDFKQPWRDCYRDLLEGIDYRGAAVYPMIPGDARTVDIAAALDYLVERGYTSVAVYQIAGLYDADLDVLARYARPLSESGVGGPAPEPVPVAPPPVPASVWEERVSAPIYSGITAGRGLSDDPADRADCDAISRKMDEMKNRHAA